MKITSSTQVMNPIFLTAYPDEEIIRRFGIDMKMITAHSPANFQLKESPDGKMVDEWGVVYQKHEEAQTHFVLEKEAPFRQATCKEEIERHPWPDPSDPSRYKGLKELAQRYRQEGFGVILNAPLMVMTQTEWMRGLGQFMMDTVLNRELLEYMLDKILEIQMEMTRRILEEVEPYTDVVVIGDDLSHQGGLTYSPDMYRRLFKPRHKAIIRFLKEHAGEAKILY
ncbi:MAG TPA: hypothetical protein VEH09_06825, partial [Thermodesulfobacteriota bacterium]|nr:hypothetical protein [Thermodesulfobacteriota bacterium]